MDIFFDGETELLLSAPFVKGVSTHGTGCTYSAAICAALALGHDLPRAVEIGKNSSRRRLPTATASENTSHSGEVSSRRKPTTSLKKTCLMSPFPGSSFKATGRHARLVNQNLFESGIGESTFAGLPLIFIRLTAPPDLVARTATPPAPFTHRRQREETLLRRFWLTCKLWPETFQSAL